MAGKSYYKIRDWDGLSGAYGPYWQRIKKMYVKTGGTTWTQVRKTYVKVKEWDGTSSGPYWKKVFDTASNAVYWNNDRPRIRLNSYRSANYVDAGRVQYMGPGYSGDSSGWSSESIGPYLYGANASDLNNIISGNGSTPISYKYEWLWNTTGNNNDDALVSTYTSPTSSAGNGGNNVFAGTGDLDRFQNSASYLGANNGDYWDKNFITFKVTATNSTGLQTSNVSDTVYIVREKPSGTISMVLPNEATPGTTMSASFTYTDNWYNRANLTNSFVEWFAVDNLGDTLISTGTGANRVQIETLSSMTGVSNGSGTSYHVPTLANKYYYVKLTLNNSSTEQAVIPSWFTPLSSFTISDNKSTKTAAANGAFSLSNGTKTGRFYNGTEFRRNVSVQIGQSSGATQYEVQIEGQYGGAQGAYDSSTSWVVLQTLDAAPYVYEADRSSGILTYSTSVTNYRNYRFTARSKNGTSTNGSSYSNNGSSSSYVYIYPPDVSPSTPVISNLTTATNSLGTYLMFDMSISNSGSNLNSTFEYSLNNGTSWQSISGYGYINETGGTIFGTGGATFNLRVRVTNLDQQTSQQSNMLSGTFASPPAVPTSVVTKSFVNKQGTIFFTTGSNTQSVKGYLDYDSFSSSDSISDYINIGSNTAGKINLTGATSSSFSYTPSLIAFSGVDQTGNSSTLQSYTNKVLAGGDAMSVSLGTPSLGTDNRTLNLSWTTTGSPTHYVVDLYYYDAPYTILATKIVQTATASFTSTDGVGYNTKYYFRVTPRYQYATGVYYDASPTNSTNITSGSNLVPPSISNVTWDGNSTWKIYLNTTGGAGPYYQIWWNSTGTVPPNNQTGYDAAGTSSPITESLSAVSVGNTIYFYARSSTENISDTTQSGNATAGTFSNWSSVYSYPVNNLSTPTISTVTPSGPGANVNVVVSGGGPTYQIYWSASSSSPTNTVTPDGFSDTASIDDSSGPSGAGTWYMYARSARSSSMYGGSYTTAPSIYISSWSAYKTFVITVSRTLSYDKNTTDTVSNMPSSSSGSDSGSGWSTTVSSSTPSRSGYTFAGWNTNSSGTGTNYSSSSSITLYSDTTLYAKWTSNSIIPTITMQANTGVSASGGTINWTSTNQASYSVDGTFAASGTTATSVSKTGLSASTTYTGTVTVTSSTGNTATAPYSLTTSAAFTTPTCVAPSLQFSRKTTSPTHLQWYCDYPTPSGSVSYISSMQFQISTTASTTGLLVDNTRSYPGAFTYPYSAGGTVWAFRAGTTDGDITYSASARYGRARVVMVGTNGSTYYGTWSGWL